MQDGVVPRTRLGEALVEIERLSKFYALRVANVFHAGDGNLHVNIIKGDLTDDQWENELPKAIRELFSEVVKLGGTLSGEHGIGLVQKPYMDIAFPNITLQIMRDIKQVFDPKGIMNPGKIF